ncbi:hypothetical protein ACRARG_04765 [Pseudooceanicola sp. C21-150M6]|uniref:hypothetical protein n=1 Tax=Pseudooceanicola sp. C21-150M6 TaxID=3434355 RepID=UPI003D7FA59D
MTPRYGRTRIGKIRNAYDDLRDAIQRRDLEAAETALERYEPWASYVFENHHCPECGRKGEG